MRRFILSIFLLFSISIKAQFVSTVNDTLELSNFGSSVINCICSDDSFYYANVNVIQSNLDWGNKILKFDKNLYVVDARSYIDTIWMNGSYPYNTIVVNERQILICPQITISNPFKVYGKIIAINKHTLDTIWTKVIEHPDTAYTTIPNATIYSVLTTIKETPDKGYILTGNYNLQCSGADKRSFLLKIDSMGNVKWRRTYSNISYLYDVELTLDGGYIVLNKYGGTNIVVLDSLGNYLWSKKAYNYIGVGTSGDLCYAGSNSFIVTTPFMYNTDISDPLMGINTWKINLNTQQIEFDKTYILDKTVECVGLHQAMGVETLADGSIIVNGTVVKYGTDYSAFILKLNANGDSLWTKTYRFRNSTLSQNQLNDLMLCDDGGFLGVGFYKPQAGYPMAAWLFKTDANGVVGFESPKAKVESKKFKVYPNPAHDYTFIELSENLTYSTELKVYNALGEMVLQKNIPKAEKELKLDLKEFRPGIYFFELVGEDGVLGSGKFVKE